MVGCGQGGNCTRDEVLGELPGLDAQKEAESVRKHYNDDAKYIITVQRPSTPVESESGKVRAQEEPEDRKRNMETAQSGLPVGDALITIIYPTIGSFTLDLNDETNLDIAETILSKIKQKLKKRDANIAHPYGAPERTPESIPPS